MSRPFVDLYKDDLSEISSRDLFDAIENFTGVTCSLEDRASEGFLLDFKQEWNEKAVKTVAAFANTFGGLLIVGVSEQSTRADKILGVQVGPRQELRTSIASSIASNISPTPAYELWDCPLPSDSSKFVCLVRVRKGRAVHYWTKKGEFPVYVRNDAESRAADAAQLQALLTTRSIVSQNETIPPLTSIGPFFVAHTEKAEIEKRGERSATYLLISVVPATPLKINLDLTVEDRTAGIIARNYPAPIGPHPVLNTTRSKSWYLATYRDGTYDHEIHWAIDTHARCYFCSQVRLARSFPINGGSTGPWWGIRDLMTNLHCTLGFAHEFWQYLGYFGEGALAAELNIGSLPLFEGFDFNTAETTYAMSFYTHDSPVRRAGYMTSSNLSAATTPVASWGKRESGTAEVDFNFADRHSNRSEIVARATNQILRDLGYAASLSSLRQCCS